jgi:FMN reductase
VDERAVLISGSPSTNSKSRALLEHARRRLDQAGFETTTVELAALPGDALLGRRADEAVTAAVGAVLRAQVVVASSPVYRASYSGLLKVFFDLLPQDALAGKVAIPILTGGSLAHLLALDHAFRPLFASIGATTVPTGVYGYDAQFREGGADDALRARVDQAVGEAVALVVRPSSLTPAEGQE